MKKKLYISPELKVYILNMKPALMAGSINDQLQNDEINEEDIIQESHKGEQPSPLTSLLKITTNNINNYEEKDYSNAIAHAVCGGHVGRRREDCCVAQRRQPD